MALRHLSPRCSLSYLGLVWHNRCCLTGDLVVDKNGDEDKANILWMGIYGNWKYIIYFNIYICIYVWPNKIGCDSVSENWVYPKKWHRFFGKMINQWIWGSSNLRQTQCRKFMAMHGSKYLEIIWVKFWSLKNKKSDLSVHMSLLCATKTFGVYLDFVFVSDYWDYFANQDTQINWDLNRFPVQDADMHSLHCNWFRENLSFKGVRSNILLILKDDSQDSVEHCWTMGLFGS